jgi:hypothetical protein
MVMSKRDIILLSTLFVWLIGCGSDAYLWLAAANADAGAARYEKGLLLPLLGFLVYRFTFLLAGFLLAIFAELIFIPRPQDEKPTMV